MHFKFWLSNLCWAVAGESAIEQEASGKRGKRGLSYGHLQRVLKTSAAVKKQKPGSNGSSVQEPGYPWVFSSNAGIAPNVSFISFLRPAIQPSEEKLPVYKNRFGGSVK